MKKICKLWTIEEDTILRRMYSKYSFHSMSASIGRSFPDISRRASKLGIKKLKRKSRVLNKQILTIEEEPIIEAVVDK